MMECRVEFDYKAQEDDELSIKKGDIITNVVQKTDGWWEGTVNGKRGMFPDNFVKIVKEPVKNPTTTPTPQPQPFQGDSAGNKVATKSNVVLRSNSARNARRLKALFSYSPEQDDELRLEVGDVIEYVAEVEEGWWRGKLKGKEGIFPSNFVSEADSSSTTTATTNGKPEPEPKNDLSKVPPPVASKTVPDVVPPAPPTSEPPEMDEDDEPPMLPPKPVREQARCFYPYQAQNEDELSMVEGDLVTIISKTCEDEGWWRGELRGKSGLFPDNFVKIITPGEALAGSKPTSNNNNSNAGRKMAPQERTGGNSGKPGGQSVERSGSNSSEKKVNVMNKMNGTTDSPDGTGSSKILPKEIKEEQNGKRDSVSSKVEKFTKMNFIPGLKPTTTTPTSPSGGVPPLSLPANLASTRNEGEEGDFNSVERGEKLNHLTRSRAKPPERRPPSAIITGKEKEENGINGSFGSHESLESPPANHSMPLNFSMQHNASSSILDTSGASENGTNDSPAAGGGSAKAKMIPPWMAELKQKQDRKHNLSGGSLNSTASPTSLPVVSTPPNPEKEHSSPTAPVKAPPLPAKPNTLSSNANTSVEKSPSISPSAFSSTPVSAPPNAASRTLKKPPAPAAGISNSGDSSWSGGDVKHYVSYEEYARLRDRVIILETELETVRKQVKILIDREFNQGHMV